MTSNYQEQLNRTKRYFNRLQSVTLGKNYSESVQLYLDDMYSFFLNCYHLKDWIKNDPTCSGWFKVEQFVSSNDDLLLCADLCNAYKHFKLEKPRSGKSPKVSHRKIKLVITEIASFSIDHVVNSKISEFANDYLEKVVEIVQRNVKSYDPVTSVFSISIKYVVYTNAGEVDAFVLAERCLDAWESYIKSNIE